MDNSQDVSMYPVTVILDETDDEIMMNSYAGVIIGQNGPDEGMENSNDTLMIPKFFIRKEHGNSYVMVNENGRLKKRFIRTGKTQWGAVEIKAGLSTSDFICFPYGKDVIDGKKAVNTEDLSGLGY